MREALSLFYRAYLDGLSIAKIMRTKGSCRFAAYYKVEWYDRAIMSWRVIQKAYPTELEAKANYKKGYECRLVKTTEKGKEIVL